jgi:hypothetical protein
MGTEVSTTIGVGFTIDPAAWAAYKGRVDPDESLTGEEVFYQTDLKKWDDQFTYGEAGSYWTGDVEPYIYLDRLSQDHDQYDLPGGIFGLSRPVITLEERQAFNAIAREIGMGEPEIGQFLAVLWH